MFGKLKDKFMGAGKKLSGKQDLLEGVCAMAALVSSVDGTIDDSEVGAVLDALAVHEVLSNAFTSSQIEAAVNKQFARAKGGMAGKLGLRKEIEEAKAKNSADDMEMAYMIAIDIANADGNMDPKEKAVLEDLGKKLGFSLSSYL